MTLGSNSHIRYLFILSLDLQRLLSFYRDVLGFTVLYQEEGQFAFLRLGDSGPDIALYPGRTTQQAEAPHWFIVINVDDIKTVAASLRAKGVAVSDIHDVPNGRAATFNDPDGNLIEIHQPTS